MSLPTPFYDEGGITIYCGDNRRIVPLLDEFDLLLTDPPYGIGVGKMGMGKGKKATAFTPFEWDASAPDAWVLGLVVSKCRKQIIWGGNYFNLGPSPCSLSWDKVQEFSGADFELAWTNLETPSKAFRMSRVEAYTSAPKFHPTQKPEELMAWCIGQSPEAQTVLDPWMGSGTTLVAAKLRGLKAVGIEINKDYCEAAVARLSQGVLLPC